MDKTEQFQSHAFDIIIVISYTLYFLILFGISASAPNYLNTFDSYVKIYVSLFLLWRFNVFRKIKFTDLDRKIAFSAGVFLFTTTTLNQILIQYLSQVKTYLSKMF